MAPGIFIEHDHSLAELENPNDKLGISVANASPPWRGMAPMRGQNRIFDAIVQKMGKVDFPYDDQCTIQYYFDIVRTLRDFNGEFSRLVEVGVYQGGSTSFFAGAIERLDFDLDLIDIDERHLKFAYERIRRSSPESIHRVRMFHGDLPTYVARVLTKEDSGKVIVHHDGSHTFNDVLKDMASLSFVRDKLVAVIAQDTNLRSNTDVINFVDLALMAVFGTDVKYAPIGTAPDPSEVRTRPHPDSRYYFLPGVPEGIVIPMAANSFHYPHPDLTLAEVTGVADEVTPELRSAA